MGLFAVITIDSVKTTKSTCANNGTITVYGHAPTSMLYSIISGPVTRAIQGSSVFGSLPSGTYQILVTDLSNDSAKVTAIVGGSYISPNFTPLYTNPTCAGKSTGIIIGNPLAAAGTTPFSWTLTNTGTSVTTTQASDTFTGLPTGTYTLRLTDSCNNYVTYSVTLTAPDDNFNPGQISNSLIPCDSVLVNLNIGEDNISVAQPYIIGFSTSHGTYYDTVIGYLTQPMLIPHATYGDSINITITNACGLTKYIPNTVAAFYILDNYSSVAQSCGVEYYADFYLPGDSAQHNVNQTSFPEPITLVVRNATTGLVVDSTVTKNSVNNTSQYALTDPLPSNQNYIVKFTDGCGNVFTHTYFWPTAPAPIISFNAFSYSCLDSTAGAGLQWDNLFYTTPTFELLSGPRSIHSTKSPYAYVDTISYPQYIKCFGSSSFNGSFLQLGNLGAGTYHYKVYDSCGNSITDSFTILPSQLINSHFTSSYIKGCPGQNQITETNDGLPNLSLVGPSYPSGLNLNTSSTNTIKNLSYGTYILSFAYGLTTYQVPVNKNLPCQVIHDTIVIPPYSPPQIKYTTQTLCNGTVTVAFQADSTKGVPPYKYQIISGPQTFGIQYSNIFLLTKPGVYVISSSDSCGSSSSFSVTVDTSSVTQLLTLGGECLGSAATLSCPYSPYYSYVWTLPGGSTYLGDSLVLNPVIPADFGTYDIKRIININGCHDTVTNAFTFSGKNITHLYDSICPGTSYVFGGISRTAAGNYFDTIPESPCDSIIELSLSIKTAIRDSVQTTICFGQSVTVGSHIYTSTGLYKDTFFVGGCDSIITTNLTVKPWSTHTQTLSICFGQSVTVGAVVHATAGTFIDTLLNAGANGCDSVVTTILTVRPWATYTQTLSICFGQSVTVGAKVHSTSATYIDTLINAGVNGCDSVVTTNLTVKPWATHTQTLNICFGQSVTVGAKVHSISGTYIDTLINAGINGCDSVVTTNLTVKPWATYTQTLSICFGQSVTVGAKVHNTSATYIDTLINAGVNGCDSVVTTILTVKPWATYTQTPSICFGQSVTVGSATHSASGTYIDTLINAGVNGCDSVVTTILTVKPWATHTQTLSICFGQSVTVGGKVHSTSATYIDTLINTGVNGCDSVVTTNLTVKPWATYTQTLSICFGQSVTVGAKVHSISGTYIDTLINAGVNACDSVVTTNLTVKPWATYTQTLSICFGQSVTVGAKVHNTSGTFIDTLINVGVNGCDSVVTTFLTVKPWATHTQTLTICFGQSVIVGANTHSASATYIDTLINAGVNGCDSVVTTILTVKPWATHTQAISICAGQSVTVGAAVHNTSATYIDTLVNAGINGCDSVVTTVLTVKPWARDTQTISICAGQSITVGSVIHNATGTYIDTLINAGANGCDSIVYTNLSVKTLGASTQTLSICAGQSITVGTIVHSTTGTFMDTLGSIGCDSIVTTHLTVKPWASYTQALTICAGQSVIVGPFVQSTSATYIDTLINAGVNGCDSVVTTNLTVKPLAAYTQSPSICFGDSVIVGSVSHKASATYIDTLVNAGVNGCDSIVTTNLTVKPWARYTQTLSICFGQSVTVGTTIHNTSATYIDTLVNAGVNGCDSVVTTNLTIKPWSTYTQTLSICFGQSVAVGGKVHNTSATYVDTLLNAGSNACDSVVTTILTVKPWATFSQTLTICANQSVIVGSVVHNTTGIFTDTLINAGVNGCDSVVTTNLTVKPLAAYTQSPSICFGDSVVVGILSHKASGTYIDTLANAGVNGCDSVVTTILTVKPWAVSTHAYTICFGDSVIVGTVSHHTSATYIDTLINAGVNGCDSVVTTTLTVKPSASYTQSPIICFGDSVIVGTVSHHTSATYIDTLINAGVNGCDSVVTTILSVKPWATYTQVLTICANQSVTVGTVSHNTTNTFIDTLINAGVNGCDSIVTTDLTVLPLSAYTQTLTICANQSVIVGTVSHNTNNIFIDTLNNAGVNGCDSIVTTNLTVLPLASYAQARTICFGDSVIVGTVSHHTTGTFIDTLNNAAVNGCDSVVSTNLTILPWANRTQSLSICFGDSVIVGTVSHNTNGTFIDTLIDLAANGCDSVVTTILTIKPWANHTQSPTICFGDSVIVGAISHHTSATYIDTLLNAGVNGCDSVVTTILTVKPWTTYTQSPIICFGDSVVIGSVSHKIAATYIDTLINVGVNGCDSVVTTILTVKPWATYTQSPIICFGDSVVVGAVSHKASATFIDTLINAGVNGCDSVVTTNLTVLPWARYTQSPAICFGDSVVVGLVSHNTSGTFVDTLINLGVNGCDSVVTTHLTVYPWSTFTQTLCIYSGQSVTVGSVSHNTTGTFIDTLANTDSHGCDSVVTTVLQVITPQYIYQHLDSCYMAIINGVRYTTDTIVRDTTFAPCGLATIFATDTLHFYDPTITIVSSAALPIVAGEPTQLSILPPGNYQNVVWSPDYQISNLFALSPIVSPREDTTYYVTLENEQHCIVKAQISIPVVGTNTPDFLMPTAFTPNGDGLNDLYRPVIKITPVDVQSFQVYDRWGLKVYDSQITGIVGWDGTYRNVAQPIGVYIYYITAKVSNGTIVSQSGNVTLIR
jgi:gliding motility-associated-like protein